jgi:hypothetical protein
MAVRAAGRRCDTWWQQSHRGSIPSSNRCIVHLLAGLPFSPEGHPELDPLARGKGTKAKFGFRPKPRKPDRGGNIVIRFRLPLAVTAAVIVSTLSALALESDVTLHPSMTPDALWKKVGDFCGISSWHPSLKKCVLSADGKERTLSVKGGGVERLVTWDDANRSYTYAIMR